MNAAQPESTPGSIDELEDRLSRPTKSVMETMRWLQGDVLLLGAGGKMGPTMARMAQRASQEVGINRRVIAVSRFTDTTARERLEAWGVQTSAGDLLDESFVSSLPDSPNVYVLTGLKFGTQQNAGLTWAMNCHLPGLICQRFRKSRLSVFSTGNVYGLAPVDGFGSRESDELAPVGEYAMAAVGRERMYEYFSEKLDLPVVLMRLNYAVEMRYGVLVDLAQQILNDQPIDLLMGHVNVIWQADASAMALSAMRHASSPPTVINIAGTPILRVQSVCERLASLLQKQVVFENEPQGTAFLNDGRRGQELLGPQAVDPWTVVQWTAEWLLAGRPTHGKPTKFQNRQGKY